ncbi:MAG: cytochrome C [Methylovirgula sp.]
MIPNTSSDQDYGTDDQSTNASDESKIFSGDYAASGPSLRFAVGRIAAVASTLLCFGLVLKPQAASALPSFARQTGQPCATCHTAFPELTPYGREFKLGGYTAGGGLPFAKAPPIAVMIQGPQFEHFGQNLDAPPTSNTHTNDNVVLGQASLFYGGQIYGNLGAFIQGTYDGVANRIALDNTDIRYADKAKLFGTDLIWGIDVNNNPTVQDVWNTTPAWGFPYITSATGPGFGPPATMLEGTFPGTVAGAGAYTWWHDMLYAEVTGYFSPSQSTLNALGEGLGNTAIDGVAPYWRLAFAPTFGEHSFMIGTFGMLANEVPGGTFGFGTDQVLDLGFDAQYQFIHEKHAFEAKVTDINEYSQYNSSFVQGITSNQTDRLNSFRATLDYVYDNTYSFTAGYFNVSGTADALYGSNSITGDPLSPNSNGFVFDVAYLPFSHGGPSAYPWLNARFGLSYTKYLTLYGGTTNFDGLGHNASGNDTLMAYSWIMF